MKSASTRSLAFTAIALLAFTGCGAQATGSVPEPDSSTSAAAPEVAPSSTNIAEETASTEETNYSGGSKAPEGEYRAADEHGPAQNVPKPVAPEGMNIESTEAMLLFIDYWNDMRNYAIQTGDTASVRSLINDSWVSEMDFYDSLDEIYKSGGWVVGGTREVISNSNLLISHGEGKYSIGSNFDVKDSVLWYQGEATYKDSSDFIYNGIEIRLYYNASNNRWIVESAEVVN
ncbi:MAG TPA: hypothetical protein H9908_05370 [Candidatus Rothia avistercoris]|uniref:DUF6318 domain-containing protein n=1 Tax=Candidatus Rothia avistercoris TaxID=2840479 RepID=A0A9D2ZST3_9MICC|nr:hypothetical protein [Candidatus Rothia avistercoris]